MLVDRRRTKSTADDRLTPADTPFRTGRDVLVIRRPGSRPILRVAKIVKKIGSKPTPIERIQEAPRIPKPDPRTKKVRVPSFDFLTGGKGPITPRPKAIAKVEPLPRPTPSEEPAVSIHKSILKGITGGISSRIQQKIAPAAIIGGLGAALPRVLPGLGRAATAGSIGAAVGGLFGGGGGGGACPVGHHLNKQDGVGGPKGTYCVKNRRMNVSNARAARRSVRRLKGTRKLLKDIEKMMPSKTRARRAPQHHHHPAAGGS